VANFATRLPENIATVSTALRSGAFLFQPARATTIPKPGRSERRPLRIFNVRDRLVQKAILLCIEPYFPDIRNDVSFAFIREQSVARAVNAVKRGPALGYKFILLADIKSFFERIDRQKLRLAITSRLPDNTLNELITQAIETDIGNRSTLSSEEQTLFPTSSTGVAQGSILSPFFSNVYMVGFDKFLIEHDHRVVRYADDLAVLAKTRHEAEQLHSTISDYLQRELGQEVYPLTGKKASRIAHLTGGFDFLGIRFEVRRKSWHLEPSPSKCREIFSEVRRWTSPNNAWPLLDRLVILSRKFEGWMRCYRRVCSTRVFVQQLDELLTDRVHQLLRARGLIGNDVTLTRAQRKFLGIQKSVRSPKRTIFLPEGLHGVRT
jgi:group II intron reverse transcriptase/maturase